MGTSGADTCRRLPQLRGPEGAPTARCAATKKIVRLEKISRGILNFFWPSGGLVKKPHPAVLPDGSSLIVFAAL